MESQRRLAERDQELARLRAHLEKAIEAIDAIHRQLADRRLLVQSSRDTGIDQERVRARDLPGLNGRGFVVNAYRTLLHREPDPNGLEYNLKAIRGGASKLRIIWNIRYSAEGRRIAADVRSIWLALQLSRLFNLPLAGRVLRVLTGVAGLAPETTARRAVQNEMIEELEEIRAESTELRARLAIVDRAIARYEREMAASQVRETQARAGPAGTGLSPADGARVIYLFVDHTVLCPFNTGMQRVTRQLGRALLEAGRQIRFVRWDPETHQLVLANREELNHLARWHGPMLSAEALEACPQAGAQRIPIPVHAAESDHWLVVPEITHITFHPAAVTLDVLARAKTLGLKTAFIFYDAIPLLRREFGETAARHAAYMQQLLLADLVVPISSWSSTDLTAFLRLHERAAPSSLPRISTLPLPGECPGVARASAARAKASAGKIILSVGSIEPRKNQLALIDAFERYCASHRDARWELFLVGNIHPDIHGEVRAALRRNPAIRYLDHVPDDDLAALYDSCAFTVFPSVEEGYGLPIVESLWHGKPCVCADFGAMAESAEGGGCLTVDTRQPEHVLEALTRMIEEPGLLERLSLEAAARPLATWADYARRFDALLDQADDRLGVIYYWVDHGCRFPTNSGIQRVTRMLARALMERGARLVPVKWDEERRRFHPPSAEELEHLARWNGPAPSAWSEWLDPGQATKRDWLLVPELTTDPKYADLMEALDEYRERTGLRRAWIFFDAIPWKMREFYSADAARSHAQYMRGLNECEKVFAISDYSRDDLLNFLRGTRLRGRGLEERIRTCALPGEFLESRRVTGIKPNGSGPIRILCVGTVEPRKNHLALLEAFSIAAAKSNRPLELVLAGSGAHYPELAGRVERMLQSVPGVRWEQRADDSRLRELYDECDFTVYPSLEEGFGLPILESLWHARPCICADFSAMAEVAAGGGCLAVDVRDASALARAIAQLADDDSMRTGLAQDATRLPFRTWRDYAREIVAGLAGERPFPVRQTLPAIPDEPSFYGRMTHLPPRPLLSLCITTYNRADWLALSLDNLFRLVPAPGADVEIIVCDNASNDRTPEVIKPFLGRPGFRYHRNPNNVGMLGNLRVIAHEARGRHVWILGDDDLVKPGAVERVLSAIRAHPDVALIYLNYAYTRESNAGMLADLHRFLEGAMPIVAPCADASGEIRDICAKSENFFTGIYCLVFRRDHALRAFSQNTEGRPFSTMLTCIPTTHYVLNHMMEEPGYWIGEPQVVVNMNVSWLKYASLWALERVPEVHDLAEKFGAGPDAVDRWRVHHLPSVRHYFREIYENDPEFNSDYFSAARLVSRLKHLETFGKMVDELKQVYQLAHDKGHPAARLPAAMVFSPFQAGPAAPAT